MGQRASFGDAEGPWRTRKSFVSSRSKCGNERSHLATTRLHLGAVFAGLEGVEVGEAALCPGFVLERLTTVLVCALASSCQRERTLTDLVRRGAVTLEALVLLGPSLYTQVSTYERYGKEETHARLPALTRHLDSRLLHDWLLVREQLRRNVGHLRRLARARALYRLLLSNQRISSPSLHLTRAYSPPRHPPQLPPPSPCPCAPPLRASSGAP